MAGLEVAVNANTTNTAELQAPIEIDEISKEHLFTLYKQQVELIKTLEATMANLNETIAYLTRKLYGSSREKLPMQGQLDLFGNIYGQENQKQDETVVESAAQPEELILHEPPAEKKRGKRSKRKDLFENVETEKKVIPVPEGERFCAQCGREMAFKVNEKVREEIEITPMQVKRIIYELSES